MFDDISQACDNKPMTHHSPSRRSVLFLWHNNANQFYIDIHPIRILPLFPNQQILCHNFVLLLAYFDKLTPLHGQDFLPVASELNSVAFVSQQGSWACK